MQPNEKLNPIVSNSILLLFGVGMLLFFLRTTREYPEYNREKTRLEQSLHESQYDVEVNGIKYKLEEHCIRYHTEYKRGGRRWWNSGSSYTVCDEYTTDSIEVNTKHTYKNSYE